MSNAEGYSDPTAERAIANVTKGENKKKRWRDMTEGEIFEIKRKKCINCFYSSKVHVSDKTYNYTNRTCDYLLIEGHSRGCCPDECNKYKPRGNKKRRLRPIV